MSVHPRADFLTAVLLATTALSNASAGEASVLAVDVEQAGGNRWAVDVTLRHGDTGWDHYADLWRVLDEQGNLLGERVLHHPHVDEQPFTRGLKNLEVPEGTQSIRIEARDKLHGWSRNTLTVDLTKAHHGKLRVEADAE